MFFKGFRLLVFREKALGQGKPLQRINRDLLCPGPNGPSTEVPLHWGFGEVDIEVVAVRSHLVQFGLGQVIGNP